MTLFLCAAASLQAACAKASIEDRGRGTDEDAGAEPKPVLPDARTGAQPDAGGLADARPGLDAGALDAGCETERTDLLSNGNFDEGPGVGWTETSSGGFALVLANGDPDLPDEFVVTADSPTFMAYLGGYNNASDLIQQDVVVPEGSSGLILHGKVRIDTEETIDSVFDTTAVEVASTDGTVLEELALFSNQDDSEDVYFTTDIAIPGDFAGQTIRVQLRTTGDPSLDTHFFFDTLELEARTCASTAVLAP